MADSAASSFTITQLGLGGHTIRLAGRALPYRPIKFSGKQRFEASWYPGSPDGTLQVFGAEEAPTQVNGEWKDRFIRPTTDAGAAVTPDGIAEYDGQQVPDVMTLAERFDEFRRAGQLVSVRWDRIHRVGIIEEFTFSPQYQTDVEWECTFQWISQQDKLDPVSVPQQASMPDFAARWSAALDKFIAKVEPPPLRLPKVVQDNLSETVTVVSTTIDKMQDAISHQVDNVLQPIDAARTAISQLQQLKDQAEATLKQFEDPLTGGVGEFLVESGNLIESQALLAYAYAQDVVDQARDQRSLSVQQQLEFAKTVDPDLIQTFVAQQDTDLRDVSTQFFGTQDEWVSIKEFNGLDGSRLAAGDGVFIPNLRERGT